MFKMGSAVAGRGSYFLTPDATSTANDAAGVKKRTSVRTRRPSIRVGGDDDPSAKRHVSTTSADTLTVCPTEQTTITTSIHPLLSITPKCPQIISTAGPESFFTYFIRTRE